MRPAYLLLFLPPFFWSTNFIVGKVLVEQVPPWTLNACRFGIAAMLLMPVFFYRKDWRRIPREALPALMVMSVTGVFAFNSVLYIGLRYTTAINATLVCSVTPVTTACLAWLLIGEKMHLRRALGIMVSFSGVVWIVSQGTIQSLLTLSFNRGDVIVFFATTLWGFYSVMAKRMTQKMAPLLLTSATTGLGAVLLVPAALLELSGHPANLRQPEVIMALVYLGIFPSLAAFVIWNQAISIFGPGRATLVYNTMPLFTVVLSLLFLKEQAMLYQLIGGAVIIGGVIIGTLERPAGQNYSGSRKRASPAEMP